MKKLMILGLMVGSSMFAATRFSVGVHIGTPAPVYTAPAYGYTAPVYNNGYYGNGYYDNGYVAPRYDRDWDHDRDRRDRDDRRYVRNDFRRDAHEGWRR